MNKEGKAGCEELQKIDSTDLRNSLKFAADACVYGFITNQAQGFKRDIEVVKTLNAKFMKKGSFKNSTTIRNWIRGRKGTDFNLVSKEEKYKRINSILRYLQGHGAGEVDFVRFINGSPLGLIYKAELATNDAGEISSNLPGIDVIIRNRFTGRVRKVQNKSNWSDKYLRGTLRNFAKSSGNSNETILVGPKELISEAREKPDGLSIRNPMKSFGSVKKNKKSGKRLMRKGEKGQLTGTLRSTQTLKRLGKDVMTAVIFTIPFSLVENGIAYNKGEIDKNTAAKNIVKDAAMQFVTGAALEGLALLLPPGFNGMVIAYTVAPQLKEFIYSAFGKAGYEKVLNEMQNDHELAVGYADFAATTFDSYRKYEEFVSVMTKHANNAILIDEIDEQLDLEIEKLLKEI